MENELAILLFRELMKKKCQDTNPMSLNNGDIDEVYLQVKKTLEVVSYGE